MINKACRFSCKELLHILSLSENATAVFTTEDLIIEYANNAMISLWGKDKNIIGMPLANGLPELKDQPFISLLQNVWRNGIMYEAKDTAAQLRIGGSLQTFYFDFAYRPIKDEAGEVYCILHTATDVTERHTSRQAMKESNDREQALNEDLAAANEELVSANEELTSSYDSLKILNQSLTNSEVRFRNLVEQAAVPIAVYSGYNLIIEIANEKMLQLWGRDKDVIGKPVLTARPEAKGHVYFDMLNEVFKTGNFISVNGVKSTVLRNGKPEEGFYDAIYQAIKNNKGEVTGVMAVAIDVTEKVEARTELENAYEQARLSKETAQLGTFDMDLTSGTMEWDARCRELFGINHSRPVNYENDFQKGLHKEDREKVLKVIDKAFNKALSGGEYDVEYRTVGAEDAQLRWVRAKGKVLFDKRDKPVRFIGSVMDITQQVEARKELERTEEMLRTAIDAAQMGTWYINTEIRKFIPSARLKELFGFYPTEEMSYDAAINQISDEYRDKVIAAVEITLQKGEPYDQEYSITGYRDKKLRWVRATGKMYEAEQGKPAHFSGTMLDITDRKLEDQRKDDFITIASHELKTPVTSLKASLQLLSRMKDNPSPVMLPKLIEQANKSMEKVSSLIESLLNASHMTAGQLHLSKTTFTIAEMLSQCCSHVRNGGRHNLILQCDKDLKLYADEHRIDQVVINFVSNAAKYAPDSRDIYLIVEKFDNKIKISVKDNGPGIAPDKMPHLFERYYRADYNGIQYSGLGLGLYISAEIIKRHDGQIGVESEPGKGSTFWFTLPVA